MTILLTLVASLRNFQLVDLHDDHTDQHLLLKLKQGDHTAFERIYRLFVRDLYAFARKNIPSREDCEEIVHDVFSSLWERRSELEIQSLRHYLFSSVRYKVIRYFRHNAVKKKYAIHYTWFEVAYETMDKENFDPETIRDRVIERIEELPERCRMVTRLRIIENLSHQQIAERLNITRKTVEAHLLQAYKHLRSAYSQIYRTG